MKRGNLRKSVLLLLMLLIMFLSSFPAFAESFNEMPKIEKEEITKTISRLDAVKIAKDFKMNFDGENILKYNSEQDALELSNREVYELLDMKEDLIAYLVLTENGYIVVNANAENPGVLMASEYGDSLEMIKQILSENSSLYFIFPFTILTEKERDDYVISNKLNIEDIISVPKITLSSDSSITEKEISPSAGNISVSLIDEANFVKLTNNGVNYYGGNQAWFGDKINRDKGCGVIALTNVISHLAKYEYRGLYDYGSVNYGSYKFRMELLADDYLSPGLLGIPFVANYNSGANKYFEDKGYSNLKSWSFSRNYAGNIMIGLGRNQPVPMLIWIDGSGNGLDTHWITITKYFENLSTGEEFIAFSSWGRRYSVDLNAILSGYVRGATFMRDDL